MRERRERPPVLSCPVLSHQDPTLWPHVTLSPPKDLVPRQARGYGGFGLPHTSLGGHHSAHSRWLSIFDEWMNTFINIKRSSLFLVMFPFLKSTLSDINEAIHIVYDPCYIFSILLPFTFLRFILKVHLVKKTLFWKILNLCLLIEFICFFKLSLRLA